MLVHADVDASYESKLTLDWSDVSRFCRQPSYLTCWCVW